MNCEIKKAARTMTIADPNGLHARVAAIFCRAALDFKSSITVSNANGVADGKSLISLLLLGAQSRSAVTVHVQGEDAPEALQTLEVILQGYPSKNETRRPAVASAAA